MTNINTLQELDELSNGKTVLVKFGAPWCGPCKTLDPILNDISEDDTDCIIVSVDVDEIPEATIKFGVRSMPTLVLYKNNIESKRTVGFKTKDEILKLIEG